MGNLLPFILIIASIGMFFGYINPMYSGVTGAVNNDEKSVKELMSEKQDYSEALTKTANIERARTGLRDQFNKIDKTKQDQIAKMLPDHIDSVRLIIDINNIAAKYGTSVSNLVLTSNGSVPSKTTSTAGAGTAKAPGDIGGAGAGGATPFGATASTADSAMYKSIKLGFSITATYENFLRFMKELEESLRIVDVTSLSFGSDSSSSQSAEPGALTYKITIRTYYSK